MRPSRVKRKLANGEPVLISAFHFFDPSVYELASLMGLDGLWLDLEHHPTSVETAATLIRAARVGVADVVARPAKGEFMRMARLLEAGAHGIMYPRCDSAEEAAELVRWGKFAPLGQRGCDGGNADMPYCLDDLARYIESANEETFFIAQLEDLNAIGRAAEIAAVPGIDILFFGVGDFSVLNGIPGQFDHPLILDAIETVSRAARRHGKVWGMPCFGAAHATRLMEQGARFLSYSSDLILLKNGLEQIQRNFGELGFTFERESESSPAPNGYFGASVR